MARTAMHPGEHLAEELSELGMSAAELTRQLGVPANRITEILNRRAITGDTALRLAHSFGSGKSIRALPTLKHLELVHTFGCSSATLAAKT